MTEETGNTLPRDATPSRPLQKGEVRVFSQENFEGQQQVISADTAHFEAAFLPASLQIGPKTGLTIFAEPDYQGASQALSANLPIIQVSRLKSPNVQSLKFWQPQDYDFRGYWAITVAQGRFLSLQAVANGAARLATGAKVTEREQWRIETIAEADHGRMLVALRARSAQTATPDVSASSDTLSLADCAGLYMEDESGSGFRKFSLLTGDDRWVQYDADGDQFLKTQDSEARAIFTRAIKIAADESQVGELRQGEAALYEHPGYWGRAWVFRIDAADFRSIDELNDTISSIQLGPLAGVTLYREAQFKADDPKAGKQDVLENIFWLAQEQIGEDTISSIDLWKVVPPGARNISYKCSLSQDYRRNSSGFQEYSAYRTTLQLNPQVKEVTVWATDQTKIYVDDRPYDVDEDAHFATFPPNMFQSLVITTDVLQDSTGGSRATLRAPALKIRTDKMDEDERIIIYPDRGIHARLANMKEDELWNATIPDAQGKPQPLIADRSEQKRTDVANAQTMVSNVMSMVQYEATEDGGWSQTVASSGELEAKAWRLDFQTYRVTANNVRVRKGPGIKESQIGLLLENEVVRILQYNPDRTWVRISRLRDGLTGWSSAAYLDKIVVLPPSNETQYRVDGKKTGGQNLIVRDGPGPRFRELDRMPPETVVTVLGSNSERTWKKIRYHNGLLKAQGEGWASAEFLTLVPNAPVPQVTALADTQAALPTGALVAQRAVLFSEVSPEEAQALSAQAVSLDASLAQGWFDDAIDWVKDSASVVVAQVQNVVKIIVTIGERVIEWVANTAQKVVAFVEGIIEKIGMAIHKLIEWLRFLFNWKDILRTRDYLRDSIRCTLDYMSHTLVEKARVPVRKFFREQKGALIQKMDALILSLGGRLDANSGKARSSGSSPLEAVSDTIEWVMSKVMGSGSPLLAFSPGGSGSMAADMDTFWNDTLSSSLQNVAELPMRVGGVVQTLIQNLSQPLLAVAELLKLIRDLLAGLLDSGEKIVMGLLDLAATMIEAIQRILYTDLRIPFLADLFDWMGFAAPDLGFSLIDAATLILAIPVTAIYKIIFNESPTRNLAPLALETISARDYFWRLGGYIASLMNVFTSAALDASDETDTGKGPKRAKPTVFLEVFSWLMTVTAYIPSMLIVIFPEENLNNQPDGEQRPSVLEVSQEGMLFGFDSFMILLNLFSLLKLNEMLKRSTQELVPLAVILGGLHMGLLLFNCFQDDGFHAEGLLETGAALPEPLSFLRLFPGQNMYLVFTDIFAMGWGTLGSMIHFFATTRRA